MSTETVLLEQRVAMYVLRIRSLLAVFESSVTGGELEAARAQLALLNFQRQKLSLATADLARLMARKAVS